MEPLTPNRIQRLMHLAEDSSYSLPSNRKPGEFVGYQNPQNIKPLGHHLAMIGTDSGTCESSSGVLDLDQIQGFGESDTASVGKSTGFFPAEITGRSTGAEDKYRNSCFNMESLTKQMEEQSNEVNRIMRHSIATDFSLHSKNLTASEASFMAKYAPIPVHQTRTIIQEASTINNMSIDSIGGYFRERCPEFSNLLSHTNGPERSSMQPSLTEVSHFEPPEPHLQYACKLDPSLDCVPVRQPKNLNDADEFEKQAEKQKEQINNILMTGYSTSQTDYRSVVDGKNNVGLFKMPMNPNVPKLEPQRQIIPPAELRKRAAGSNTEYLVKAVTKSSVKASVAHDEELTEGSTVESSMSLSKIAEFLGNQSTVNVSDIIDKYCRKDKNKPLSEANRIPKHDPPVTYLKETRNIESANSAGSVKTVISMKPGNQENRNIPGVIVTQDYLTKNAHPDQQSVKSERTRSKSPSTRSRSTLSTVQENLAGESPVRVSSGEVKPSHVPSPNFEYKELDKSVDWQEVMRQARSRQSSLAKEPWIEINTTPVNGYVGVNYAASISITTKSENWLTATLSYDQPPNKEKWRLLRIELPHQLLLLSPGKTEKLTINITSTAAISTELPFIITVKDSSIDSEQEQKGILVVNFKLPEVRALSRSGANQVVFPPTQKRTLLATTLVLLSDSPVDLQLSLSLVDGRDLFSLKNVQEIKMSEVNKLLGIADEKHVLSKLKNKLSSAVQLCRLTSGNAIRATVVFEAPNLQGRPSSQLETYKGAVLVTLIGVAAELKTIELSASVGAAALTITAADNKLSFTKEPKVLHIQNHGSLAGVWNVHVKDVRMFNISATKLDISPGETKGLSVSYTGPEDTVNKAMLTFEETTTSSKTSIEITGGMEKFPIKSSNPILSWVRSGRKEISLKNFSDKKVLVRCDIAGDAFTIDVPGVDARGVSCIISFSPNECRQLPIVYSPTTHLPNAATLIMKIDKNNDYIKKIHLFGCLSGDALRWSGLATYGETALVRAVPHSALELTLTNRSPMPAFVCARVHFNLQYMSVASSSRLLGACHVVRGRGSHVVSLRVEWPRVERLAREGGAATLATITALTGPEVTRHRILRILRNEGNGEVDASLLPENLKMLVGPFEGDEVDMDAVLSDFRETRASLVDLIGGLQELKAQIDLPVDISEETIIIPDATIIEHHTMLD